MQDQIIAHFTKVDPILAPVIAAALTADKPIAIGLPTKPEFYFRELAEAVINQQLATKAAATIWRRFVELLKGEVTPENVIKFSAEELRTAGVSRQKAGYLHAMAQAVVSGEVKLETLPKLSDEEVIKELTKLKGIGPWTAEMFLMFTLGRPDVFSYLDLGLLRAFEIVYNQPGATRAQMEPIVAKWSPYRTYAALALWHSRDNKPLI